MIGLISRAPAKHSAVFLEASFREIRFPRDNLN